MPPRSLGALLVVLVVLGPVAQATVDLTASISFDARDRYTLRIQAVHADEHGVDQRAAVDRDQDGTVTGEEASRYKAELQATLEDPGATGHRLDGHRPTTIDVARIQTDGLIGDVDQDGAVHLVVSARYTYALNTTGEVVFQVQRDRPPGHVNETLVLHAPDRHRVTDLWNISGPGGSPEVTNQTGDGHVRVTGVPTGSWRLTLVPRDPSVAVHPSSDQGEGGNRSGATDPNGTPPATGEPLHRIQPPEQAPSPGAVTLLVVLALGAIGRHGPRRKP